jgi:NAD(P)-dependent dehydrogenase (short-subunit alcohol dehydrogenase family)
VKPDGQTVLTTGANSGSGLLIALHLAELGFRSVGSVRSPSKAKIVAKAAADAGLAVETVLMDLGDAARNAEVIDELRPVGIVNNAGFMSHEAMEEVEDDRARAYLETHVIAPMRLARLALPHMRAAGEGRIVQVSSLAGRVSFPLLGWYAASKHALEAASDALRNEVAREGIHVSLVEPGGFDSGISHELIQDHDAGPGPYDTAKRRAARQFAMMRPLWAAPDDVAKAVGAALTSPRPRIRYIVGLDAQVNIRTAPFTPAFVRDRVMRLLAGL